LKCGDLSARLFASTMPLVRQRPTCRAVVQEAGVCPSCNARRMCGTAAHLTDEVMPEVPLRQWVLSVPFELRLLLARDPRALTAVGRIFVQEIFRSQRERARGRQALHRRCACSTGAIGRQACPADSDPTSRRSDRRAWHHRSNRAHRDSGPNRHSIPWCPWTKRARSGPTTVSLPRFESVKPLHDPNHARPSRRRRGDSDSRQKQAPQRQSRFVGIVWYPEHRPRSSRAHELSASWLG